VRRLLYLAVAVGAIGLIALEVATAGSSSGAKQAPALPKQVLQGPPVTLAKLQGKPVLIDFWASWCEPCREEAPEIARLQHSPAGAAIVGIDYTDQEENARSFIHKYGWTFPVLSDPDGIYGARFGFSGLPTAVVLHPDGGVSATLRGPQSLTDFRRALREAG
jgi:cytochrome c biogenesis protein CcmG, thiol:disulfide interchange protein DsbE